VPEIDRGPRACAFFFESPERRFSGCQVSVADSCF
jgi:hypothetical protein